MFTLWFYSITAVVIVSLISLVGIFSLALNRKRLERILLFLVSFAVGGLLGDVFLHLLPEVSEEIGFNLGSSLAILGGLLVFFVLEKFIAWRHCHVFTSEEHPHPVVLLNLIGDGVHNFFDGAIIAGSFLASIPLGIATSLAVIFHEIPQEIGDFGILIHGGLPVKKALAFNFLSSIAAILGAILVLLFGLKTLGLEKFLLPFTAGGFIYIAGSDLIPELHKETNPTKSLVQFGGIVLGIAVMLALKILY